MSPKSSSEVLMSRRARALMVPVSIGTSYDLPVRLSVMVSVSLGAWVGRGIGGLRCSDIPRLPQILLPEHLDQAPHVARRVRSELDALSRDRVQETEGPRVQGGPVDERRRLAVALVPEERVARLREVHPDLVSPPGLQPDGQHRGAGQALGHRVLGERLLPLARTAGGVDLEALPVLDQAAL